ncbi:hypothetical protein NYE54_08285 [Paenibacillus sp. FSL K6-1330]|uniref:DUF7667 family protein n=1 Tax=Paenibacillus sp. FSL K6-1330 TaxID=2975292 RepID=UPI0030D9AE95
MAFIIHPVHRRMTELSIILNNRKLTSSEQLELVHCLKVNADLVQQTEGYKEAAYAAHTAGNMDLVQHFSEKLDEMEAKYS